jgi:eukaryotic-like serine/threonine-protein kinase
VWSSLLKSSRRRASPKGAAHLTYARSQMGRSLSNAGLFLKRQLWIWPIIAVLTLSIVGYFVLKAIGSTIEASVAAQLQGTLEMQVAMLDQWYVQQKTNAEALANSPTVREATTQLLTDEPGPAAPPTANAAASAVPAVAADPAAARVRLQRELAPWLTSYEFVNFFVCDKEEKILAASQAELVGQSQVEAYREFVRSALKGKSTVSAPFKSVSAIKNADGVLQYNVPTMFVAAPIRDTAFQVIGAIVLRIRPDARFTTILQTGRIGESGETYAINRDGVMASNSRFDNDLILSGILPETDAAASILNVRLADPGGDVTSGFRPGVRRSDLPLNKMAASLVAGNAGLDAVGYRDYRGVPVVGAWRWLNDYSIGIATEVDYAEAYRPLTILRWVFGSLYVLLLLLSAAIFVFTLIVARLDRKARAAAIEAKQLGQYQLAEKLGAGAMGVVYKGHHAMMRRATAIKLLDADKTTPAAIERFEREVQMTCQLNHPNTISIFDYGRTPEGVFYYAMEYLDGIALQDLVDKYGPMPEERVIHVLLQICGSLFEAHSLGLVHRDIKPANIMLNRRGAMPDLVKVLDFGLVKAQDDKKGMESTRANSLLGTPLYMSPEAIENPERVDARSDLYAVGAVGYFLLTGEVVFNAPTLVDLCRMHVAETPKPPSLRTGRTIVPELENAILACLEKSPARRPQTARDLALRLERCRERFQWTTDVADEWWDRHSRGLPQLPRASAFQLRQTVAASASLTEERFAVPEAPASRPPVSSGDYGQTFIGPGDES